MACIFHLRLKDFQLQAERTLDASLRTRPLAIISSHHQNGTVVALSGEARAEGLTRGMKVSLAREMSHSALLLPYNRFLYARLNSYIYAAVQKFTPLVEPAGYGKFYLDMTGTERLHGSHEQTGSRLSDIIRNQISLSSVVGISTSKLVSRISTAVVPERIHRVASGGESNFLSPLDSPVIPAANEPVVLKMIRFLILKQVRQIQAVVAFPEDAQILFGSHSLRLTRESNGQDTSVVKPPILKDHILEQTVLPEDSNDEMILWGVVKNLAEQVAFKLRRNSRISKKVRLEIHYTDGFRHVRKGSFPANDDFSVFAAAWRLFELANTRRNRIRSVLIDVTDFLQHATQETLFPGPDVRNASLAAALEIIRRRHGFGGIQWALNVKN